jgi:hypothetical protein
MDMIVLMSIWQRCILSRTLFIVWCLNVGGGICLSVRPFSFCVAHSSKSIWHRVMKLYRNVAQHIKLCTWVFACGFFFCFVRVIALDLVNIFNFQLVLYLAQKVFDLGSWNFTEMLISMCSYSSVFFHVNLLRSCRVIALDLVKICYFQLVLCPT